MVRTQVLLPDALYQHAKQVADAREISLAELIRRGVELLLDQYPPPEAVRKEWRMPVVRGLGWKGQGLTHEQIRDEAQRTRLEEEAEED